MDHALRATYYRTALLLGLIQGALVHRWAEQVIDQEPASHPAFFEIVSASPGDLSALRYALWPLVIEPDPPAVIEELLGGLNADLASGARGLADTITVLRQMRSMLRLPPTIYEGLNATLVAHVAEGKSGQVIAKWLQEFEQEP